MVGRTCAYPQKHLEGRRVGGFAAHAFNQLVRTRSLSGMDEHWLNAWAGNLPILRVSLPWPTIFWPCLSYTPPTAERGLSATKAIPPVNIARFCLKMIPYF